LPVEVLEDDQPRSALRALSREDEVERERALVSLDALDHERRRLGELVQSSVDQPLPQRRYDREIDDRQRAGDEAGQRQRQLETDRAKPVHESRNR
jgi:hypothetical protein